jgi:anti-anti-sigma regulatory factor
MKKRGEVMKALSKTPAPVATTPVPTAKLESRWLKSRVFLYQMHGKVDEESVKALLDQGAASIAQGTCDYVVIDTTDVEGYSLAIRQSALQMMRFVKDRGVKELVGVAPNQLVRTFAATMSFAVGLKLPLFDSLAAAEQYIRRAS